MSKVIKPPGQARTADFRTLERESRFINPPKDKSAFPLLQEAVQPHIGSFNALTEGPDGGLLNLGVKDIGEKVIFDGKPLNSEDEISNSGYLGNKLSVSVEQVSIAKPMSNDGVSSAVERKVYPSESRQRLTSYRGKLLLKLKWSVNNGEENLFEVRDCGGLPVMLQSNRCHLNKMSPYELVQHKEESDEIGGYFIVNGIEKLIRMLIVQRRNHPMAIIRPSFANRGASYSHYGIQIRSVRPDQTSQTNVLHYLNDGQVTFRFSWRKNEYLVPVVMILKALCHTSDREIFDGIIGNDVKDSFLTDRLELLLRGFKKRYPHLQNRTQVLQYLGDKFRVVFQASPDQSDLEVGQEVLDRIVLVHLGKDGSQDKFRMLLFMIRKLYSLVAGECSPDNPDATQHQEVLLGGFLYGMILKEKIDEYLQNIIAQVRMDINRGMAINFKDKRYMSRVLMRVNENIGSKMQYFLSTGNLVSQSGLDLQQVSGYTVVAEKINFYRFISHFRMVHRGSFFAQLKTTTVRKLLPESWGFLCPVHTPDGSPCGLLNHFAHKCRISTQQSDVSRIPSILYSLGVAPASHTFAAGPSLCCVQIDGKIIGWVSHEQGKIIADTLRYWKVEGKTPGLPIDLEIGYVPPSTRGQYPGLYLFGGHSRMLRPVRYLPLDKEDIVGPFEQVYMNIAVTPQEIQNNVHTHVEFTPTNILSILANLTPFSDFNQSPRNMYQCQMGKQTMGTPGVALCHRSDNKLYRLQTGQTPIVKANLYDDYGMDNFPNGFNAVVAVISYTGYDMDDAMIINKSADERGFGYGTMYKTEKVDLALNRNRGDPITQHFGFGNDEWPKEWLEKLDEDGLPYIGTYVEEGDPICAYFDDTLNKTKIKTYHSSEPAYIEEVNLIGDESNKFQELQTVSIKYRIRRTPQIGDKFSSRHGQKGVCSRKWPTIDMPFSETGIQPDIIINPHAFPSRMTIGMFVESLAGKAGALHGIAQDSTPWIFNEDDTPADYFGEQLAKAGYNYHGNEPMYSGATGEELRADIYVGVVYYQRLRHMVNDKFQVRSTGPVNSLTMQPVKGRKRHGGIRVGEMERDALIGHGTSFLLQDRLLNSSDYTQASVCRECGSILTTQQSVPRIGSISTVCCRRCSMRFEDAKKLLTKSEDGEKIFIDDSQIWEDGQGNKFVGGNETTTVAIPFVLKYLDSELSAMGIRLRYNVEPK
ncbi:AQG_2a_G0056100.mRNA.1.CDS.1 [Saccharomyces cerevisiae]|uniref:DNA-directed RNA polymerase I subunit RPA135 n=4 Tax=Saccharomyces cerevisiae TaxID=4932 RepID=RPA2_YEAST|nr:DNA-directed RNA polymerase I core subunit RPA135 [Saccharomyces cerevisiae S288C]P22138.1 RecName: Full=DNA-directed RNA polymerase I subunit RPA135; AltName: Full=DNA-directed RNA polymerase I 135 kDa polypeptide; Short=A135; AltName: Full=DNA-directed RNA polymerase I polypeptide 2; Short=RNA polymerase I subunit 2 [Saccharomyces cerevisiae S288C]4C2M_B Chain B, Dna-directed Rna Polymerase I Subunit Rpa135 [Saccharomyces cerevisiae]4C2M_Q Chain Q, Dna-directed Rna Polymerase I Subunit Rpa1|eukprot:NP_015335.1 DNA-directed RNA polymerase I core subunit RPA135 [Saccharomyces cerevisiae S288C]